MFRWNPEGDYPQIDDSAYLDPTAVIIGKVRIEKNVFVGPGAVIRADEPGSSIVINDNCNIQDRVIIHALSGTKVMIGKNSSLAHGCIIHGPCEIARGSFVGFGSIVFNSTLKEYVFIKHLVVVEGVYIPPRKFIPNGAIIDTEKKARSLGRISKKCREFSEKVIKTNMDLVKGYRR